MRLCYTIFSVSCFTGDAYMAEKKSKGTSGSDKSGVVYYRRLMQIDEMIASGRRPTIEDFRNMEEGRKDPIGRATIFRMIQFLKDQLHAPVEYDRVSKGYYYSDTAFRLPSMFTTEGEMFAAALTRNMIEGLRGTSVYDSAKAALDKLQKSAVKNPNEWNALHYNPHDDTKEDWITGKFVFLQDTRLDIDDRIWKGVCDALRYDRTIMFSYSGNGESDLVQRTADPYQALYARGTWYLFTYDHDRKDHRIFALNRMSNLQLGTKFTPIKGYSFSRFSKGVFGAFVGEETQTFRIQFYENAVPYVSERVWGDDQKIVKHKDGSIVLSFRGTEEYEIRRMVLSFADLAVPLAPKSLVDEWKEDIARMAKESRGNQH
jgi:predicted DNA-binding transcriptional regulator YafY